MKLFGFAQPITSLLFYKIKWSLKIRVKWVIWILIAARSWQWAVVARNKQNFTFISFNAGTVGIGIYSNLDYIYTPSLTSYWISNGEMWKFTIRTEPWVHAYIKREFTLIRSVNSRLFDTRIHAYSMREFTLIRCVNSCLFDAWINACTNRELILVRSVKSCQRIQRIFLF